MGEKVLNSVLIILEAVRPYPRTKQVRSTNNQAKKRVPLQDAPNKINEGKKRTNKKPGPKRNRRSVASKIVKKDDYSLENLRAIFEEEEKAETKLEFRATSTPFNSQLVNSQVIEEEQINNQRELDLEINKIHDSINKESLILLMEQLSPPPTNGGNRSLNSAATNKPQKKLTKPTKAGQQIGAKKAPRAAKSNTKKTIDCPAANDIKLKKNSKKKEIVNAPKKESTPGENKRDQILEKPKQTQTNAKSKPVSKCRTRLESKSKVNSKPTPKAPTKTKFKPGAKITTRRTRASRVRYKGELTYKQLLLKCVKGKDPIDLLL